MDALVRTAFMDSRTSRPLFGMGEFCTGGSGMPFVPRCFWIWYAENRREALRSSSPPLCNAASASSCFGGSETAGPVEQTTAVTIDRGLFRAALVAKSVVVVG